MSLDEQTATALRPRDVPADHDADDYDIPASADRPGDLSMAMTSHDIPAHPTFEFCVRGQTQALLLIHQASPRTASRSRPSSAG